MDAHRYYNERSTSRRSLKDGDGVRNTHNFIKASLIDDYIPRAAHILDLGCGQGGDLLKYKHVAPRSYRGIDISHVAIEAAARRIAQINLRFRVRLECFDFSTRDWWKSTPNKVYAVSCQFAIQYAFASEENAAHVIACIERVLRPGGVFLGTVPVHDIPSYGQVIVRLPDDARPCVEYSAQKSDIVALCAQVDLQLVMWESFKEYHERTRTSKTKLCTLMRAVTSPNPSNAVFVFKKKHK